MARSKNLQMCMFIIIMSLGFIIIKDANKQIYKIYNCLLFLCHWLFHRMAIGISWNKMHTLHLIVTFSLSKIEWEYWVSITLDALMWALQRGFWYAHAVLFTSRLCKLRCREGRYNLGEILGHQEEGMYI